MQQTARPRRCNDWSRMRPNFRPAARSTPQSVKPLQRDSGDALFTLKGVAMVTLRTGSRLLSLAALGCLLAAPVAQAETPLGVHSTSEAKAMYKHDTDACRRGAVSEPRR